MGAPQVTIETITVTRPLKVIAFTCCVITVLLMVVATSTADWMIAEGWREGLFMQCVYPGAKTPLPFGMDNVPGCSSARTAHYLGGCAALVIFGLIFDFFGTTLTCLGLKSTDPNKKYKYYRVSIYALILAGILLLLAAIIYPVQFSKDLSDELPYDGGVVEPILNTGDHDFDNDNIPDHLDDDDDNDGIPDLKDLDDDNDGINDDQDNDDDNDGIADDEDGNDEDFDNDGLNNDVDDDDDNDGIPDNKDDDDDNDGIIDSLDSDDDNDGIKDNMEEDTDGDGVVEGMENNGDDDDDDDEEDENKDTDGDGIPDSKDGDKDGDGIANDEDEDDDNDGVDDEDEYEGARRVYSFGFGYGATWGSIILIFASVVLLICDRESEEIFYKERQIEEEEEEETGEA